VRPRARASGRTTGATGRDVVGTVRPDRRTKLLVKRLAPGDIAVIDHEDLDRVAAESLVRAEPAAVVNGSRSISGRYPNVGPLLLAAAGIPLLDDVGHEVLQRCAEGAIGTVRGDELLIDGVVVASGTLHTLESLEEAYGRAEKNVGAALEAFVSNTVEYIGREAHLFLPGQLEIPDVDVDMAGRHALIVVRGADYREDLMLLRQTGYLGEKRPVLIGVDGGADALLELGLKPDVIIGDFDSVSEASLRSGATLVVHAFPDGRAPGAPRLDAMGLAYERFEAPGTSEDIAMLLADHHGAELLVAVGTHSSMVDFLDKGRSGMSSTVLVRMVLGPKLVDAKGVSRLYQTSVRPIHLAALVGSACLTLVIFAIVSEPVRLLFRSIWYRFT
jgi:uncharacterized membrane-anchored protein